MAAAAAAPGGRSVGPTVTDQEITIALHSILREETNPNPNSGPTVTTFNDVFRQLQSKLGVDLFHKLDFIRSQIQLLLRFPAPQPHQQPQSHPAALVPPTNDHFVFHSPHAYPPHHPHHLSNFHPSPSAFHTFPPPVGHHHHAQVQFQAQAHPQLYPVASRAEPPPKESAPVKPKRKAATGGLSKLCRVSPELQAIVGQPAMPRTEIVRQLWVYIRKNNLQDPSNKRKIICNDELRLVFETDSTDMFQMNKLLAKHISRLEPTEESEAKKLKVEAEAEPEIKSSTEPSPPVKISVALTQFFGVNETEMPESEITDRISQYINLKQLQDSENPSLIRCDAKLQEILGRENIPAQEIPDVLADRNHIRR
ncbi:hypothetical protein MLD38_000563 [Melastoma candidum]|uniref:Uncharacterized protein n=1 Tax=Melastoma candidum TaxID=119954 RepID=A0ACB9SAF8_9MYRT|nr:hypothetical protein MLD38_000563 [Melastoma candidum]